MSVRKLHVINLYGGPGTGKSTTAAGLFSLMKWAGYNVELVTEFAKDLVWEDRIRLLREAQPLILGEQFWRLKRLQGKVDVAICDSPLLLSLYYNGGQLAHLDALTLELYDQFENFNVVLERNPEKPYMTMGRLQTEEEAKQIGGLLVGMLKREAVPYLSFPVSPDVGKEILSAFHNETFGTF